MTLIVVVVKLELRSRVQGAGVGMTVPHRARPGVSLDEVKSKWVRTAKHPALPVVLLICPLAHEIGPSPSASVLRIEVRVSGRPDRGVHRDAEVVRGERRS